MRKGLLRALPALFLAAMLLPCGGTWAEDAQEGALTLPERAQAYACRLEDANVNTYIMLSASDEISLTLSGAARGLSLKWLASGASYLLLQYDAAGELLLESTFKSTFLNEYHTLLPACRLVTVRMRLGASLCELAAYPESEPLPSDVQIWQPACERADLLVIAGSPGAELRALSGLLPLYACERKAVTQVVYLSTAGQRERAEEALCGLWAIGFDAYPTFVELPISNIESQRVLAAEWGGHDKLLSTLAALIRQYRPLVIAAPGGTDEYDDLADSFVADMLPAAVLAAADSASILPRLAQLEAWQTQKLYVSGGGAEAYAPDFSEPLVYADGASAYEMACTGYLAHRSLQFDWRRVKKDVRFTLAYSAAGLEKADGELFSGIAEGALQRYVLPTPVPTATPVPTPAPTPAAAVTPAPTAPAVRAGTGANRAARAPWFMLGAGAALAAAAAGALLILFREPGERRKRLWLCAVPLLLGAALAALLLGRDRTLAAVETSAPAAVPAPTSTPLLTPAPTLTPAASSTPTSAAAAWPDVFRQPGEPEEVVSADDGAGRWSYRTDSLSIAIERRTGESNGKPVTYFVAHIYVKDAYQFRAAFGSPQKNGHGSTLPWRLARQTRAVLMITGDNIINMERRMKGIIIREGRVYNECAAADTAALYPDLTLRIFRPGETTAAGLLSEGVRNTFSFGPTLVRDGQLCGDVYTCRLKPYNPRTGIGMVSPGHFVAIVVDGRDNSYSVGARMFEFGEMFLQEGCTVAYNLDGGASTAMVFMGEQINYHAANERDDQRPVPDGLVWGYSHLVPGEDEPVGNTGQRPSYWYG